MVDEIEAVAAVLEGESQMLKRLTDEAEHLRDPVALERNRQERERHLELFRLINEKLAVRIAK